MASVSRSARPAGSTPLEGERPRRPDAPAHAASADVADSGSAMSSSDSCSASTPQTQRDDGGESMSAEAMA